MACIIGTDRYLTLTDEAEWGQYPGSSGSGGSGTEYFCPVTSYGVGVQRLTRIADVQVGLHQRKHQRIYGANVSGQLVAPLFGWKPSGVAVSLAEKLITWGFGDYETDEPISKAANYTEGLTATNKRHTGLRVNQATLSGSADNGEISLSLDLIGQQELGGLAIGSLPTDMEKIVDMQFVDCTFTINGSTAQASAFSWSLNRNLQSQRLNEFWITSLCGALRDESLQLTIPKTNATYDVYQRLSGATADTEITAVIVCRGLHNGTGTGGTNYTKMTATFNRLAFLNKEQAGDFGIQMQPLTFTVLKPDSSSNTTTIAWSEE
jgi:hypothetical protein